jgi:hypothetical protein
MSAYEHPAVSVMILVAATCLPVFFSGRSLMHRF